MSETTSNVECPFDAIHASPPCQKYTTLQHINKVQWGTEKNHPDMIADMRSALRATGKPYIIENVQGSPLETQVILCGYSMGLPKLARHRHFESNFILFAPKCTHRGREVIGVYGGLDGRRVSEKRWKTITYAASTIEQARELMGIDWMEWNEIKESIPPKYTEYLGAQLIDVVFNRRAA
jgi:DNA (cytosine-5)-methyltransferase 1